DPMRMGRHQIDEFRPHRPARCRRRSLSEPRRRRSPIVAQGPDSDGGGKMFARVSTLHGPPDLFEASLGVIRQEVVPAFRQRSGFKGILSLVNPERGTSITVSLWHGEADMQASDEEAQSLRAWAAEAGHDQIVSVERYEVGLY